jgi:hypothetical protein
MARPPTAATEDILAKFPGPVILYPSKLHLVHLFIVGIVFFVGSIWLLKFDPNPKSSIDRAALIGCAVMGGLGAPLSLVAFLPRAAFLRLDGAGFVFANCFYKRRFSWSDVEDFGVWTTQFGTPCSINFRAAWRGHFIMQFLPDPYGGLTFAETVALMNSWRNLAIPSSVGQVSDGGQRLVRQAEKLGRSFARVTPAQRIGLAIVGLGMIAALVVFFSSTHVPQLSEPSDPILSNHGPERVACDSKWNSLQQADPGSYRQFLQDCMNAKR